MTHTLSTGNTSVVIEINFCQLDLDHDILGIKNYSIYCTLFIAHARRIKDVLKCEINYVKLTEHNKYDCYSIILHHNF